MDDERKESDGVQPDSCELTPLLLLLLPGDAEEDVDSSRPRLSAISSWPSFSSPPLLHLRLLRLPLRLLLPLGLDGEGEDGSAGGPPGPSAAVSAPAGWWASPPPPPPPGNQLGKLLFSVSIRS